jgi:hypothetical protein
LHLVSVNEEDSVPSIRNIWPLQAELSELAGFSGKIGQALRNFKADAVNPIVLSGLQPKMTLKSRKLEGGKAAAEKSMQQSHMDAICACFISNSHPLPSLNWARQGPARAGAGPSPWK